MDATREQIARDLPRTPLGDWAAAGDEGDSKIRESVGRIVLAAAARANRCLPFRVPYLQGMTWLAAPCASVFHSDEASAFWLLCTVLEQCVSPEVFAAQPPLCGHRADAALLHECMRDRLAPMARRFGDDDLAQTASLLATRWLLTAFVDALPPTCVLALWDQLLLPAERAPEGSLRSMPLFVWAVSILSAAQASLLAALGRRGGGDPDTPAAVRLAVLASAACRGLPPGFRVQWMDVPGWDAASLARRHGQLRRAMRPATKSSAISGALEGLRHVWRPSGRSRRHSLRASKSGTDDGEEMSAAAATASTPAAKSVTKIHPVFMLEDGAKAECSVVRKLLAPINAPTELGDALRQRRAATSPQSPLCSFDLAGFLSAPSAAETELTAAEEQPQIPPQVPRLSGGALHRPAVLPRADADPFATLWSDAERGL
eukprot:TRINITY_DN1852_c1_g4_i1.p1 TRINITY_DN1852_c1_g4~~TRINITY_DN1852_c1_g4_i1.p1  ORF type:complete len:490 (+),score=160.80 TRINITY_DN1852_c1_g4_i1:178-1470(+)